MKLARLWPHAEFRKLGGGQGVSRTGHRALFFAMPLQVVVVLAATPFQMAILIAMEGCAPGFGIGSVGPVVGSAIASRYTVTIGVGRLMTTGMLLTPAGAIGVAFAAGVVSLK